MSSGVGIDYEQVDRVGSDIEHSESHAAAPQAGREPSSRSAARSPLAAILSMLESCTVEPNSR
jgi:hypothetical protein